MRLLARGEFPQIHGLDRITAKGTKQIGIEELADQGKCDDLAKRENNLLAD